MEHILNSIKKERVRQDEKFGIQNNKPIEWIAILTEEVGEASKEALEHHFKYDLPKDIDPSAKLQIQRLNSYKKELIECAAVCLNAIQSLERNELKIKKNE